jgi:glycosyltransferase involved in cell wall biosynthesis
MAGSSRGAAPFRIGWVASAVRAPGEASFGALPANVAMRVANIGRWIGRRPDVESAMYDPSQRYDLVVFFKAMDEACQDEARRIQAGGGRVVFDANVNYYDVWGDYDIPGTQPTPEQQRDATAMTRLADAVVADSSYLLAIVEKLNPRASWVPDNVDVALFRPPRLRRRRKGALRLIWSGMAPKAKPLVELVDVLGSVDGLELLVVSNERPAGLERLEAALPCRFARFDLRGYARKLRASDVILSPKNLVNGYELGHTEWKITLGMACGLPAVASPQQSYREAIGYAGGGVVCEGPDEWRDALVRLRDDEALRYDLGERAARTVRERYATPLVAASYLEVLEGLR